MKTRLLPSLALLAILLAACAPPASPAASAPPVVVVPSQTPVPAFTSTQPTLGPTESLVPTALAAATSRGPNLEATDPTTVNLATGQLQLVEFFRFT